MPSGGKSPALTGATGFLWVGQPGGSATFRFSVSGTKFSWYDSSSNANENSQLNTRGAKYYYFGIG